MSHQVIQIRHHGDRIIVTEEGYEELLALVGRIRCCERCEGPYTEQNPRVALNRCARCFISEKEGGYVKPLSLIGTKERSYRDGEFTYLFVDGKGMVYFSHSTQTELYESAYDTLLYHGFPVPVRYQRMGKEYTLDENNWHIHGDIHDSVVVIRYLNLYSDHLQVVFLSRKRGTAIELDKHKTEIKRLFTQARAKVEASRRPNGDYSIGGHAIMHKPGDEDLYEVIAELESRPASERQAHLIVDLL